MPFATRLPQLIVNADDFGFTRGVNQGIVEAHQRGIVTATTLMAHGRAFDHAVELARATPTLDVGVHLVLWEEDGLPQRLPAFLRRGLGMSATEIERLFSSQVERVRQAGISPSHLDTHKHVHLLPNVMRAVEAVAVRFGIRWVRRPLPPLRWFWRPQQVPQQVQCSDHFKGLRLTGRMDRLSLAAELRQLRPGITELMCHPGYHDAALDAAPTRLKAERQRELDALTAPEIRVMLEASGVQLIDYRHLISAT